MKMHIHWTLTSYVERVLHLESRLDQNANLHRFHGCGLGLTWLTESRV